MLDRVDPRRLPKKLIDSASGKLDDVVRSQETAKRVSGIEDRFAKRRREAALEEGTLRGVCVLVHRGWIAHGEAKVHARVVEAPRLPDDSSRVPYWDVVSTNLRRHAVLAFPEVQVEARVGEASATGITDRHGYAAITVPVGELTPGWHEVTVTTLSDDPDAKRFTGKGRMLQPDLRAPFAVVSDIDDTVIRTGLDEGLTALRRTLFRDAHTRRAVPGMSSLYRGLERGVRMGPLQAAHPSFFYVSTGSWAFYEMLTQFLQLRGYPRGPLFLTDWGPSDRYLRRSGAEHKRQALARLREGYPQTPLLLIGDSGQKDPDIYLDFARDNPDRVACIVIVKADGSDERTQQLQREAPDHRALGIPYYVVEDARKAAKVLHDLGMCDDITLVEVDTEMGAVF